MGFNIPSRESLFNEGITDYRARFPEKDSTRGSDGWRLLRVVSGVAWSVAAKLLNFDKQRLFDTATGEFLARWGGAYKFPKKGPSPSQAVESLEVVGTPGTAVPVDEELTHADGTLFKIASVGLALDDAGTALADVVSLTLGSSANKSAGETLTFSDPPAGITAEATLVADLTGGADNEDDEDFRPRLKDRVGDPPQGRAIADYYQDALKVPGVDYAFVYEHRRGLGTIDIAVLRKGNAAARLVADLSPVTAALNATRAAGMKDFKVLTVVLQPQDIAVELEVDETTYKWDWDDAGVGYVITAYNSGAKTLTVPTAPASAIVGSRITVNGEEARIAARGGSVLTLEFLPPDDATPAPTWFSADPAAGTDVIRASGDLVVPMRAALIAEFAKLGPARGDGVTVYGATTWEDRLRLARIDAAAMRDTPGVVDMDVLTPTGNVTPIDTFGDTVPLLVPGKIIVTKKVS
jgi:uncharacterized phage protein gp47/JayE